MNEQGEEQRAGSQIAVRVDSVRLELGEKDLWDKVASISTFVSGIIVALIGFYATTVYNARQQDSLNAQKERELSVLRVQTVEKFFTHLASEDQAIRLAALDSIAALGDEKLAASLAARFGGEAGATVLADLANSSNPAVAEAASRSLAELFAALRPSVVQVTSGNSGGTIASTGFFVSTDGLAVVPSFAIDSPPIRVARPNVSDTFGAQLVKVDEEKNLALIRVDIPDRVPALGVKPIKAAVGESVVALGWTGNERWRGISGKVTLASESELQTTLPSESGMAGAPIVNSNSEIVGMSIGKNRAGNVGAPSSLLYAFLNQ